MTVAIRPAIVSDVPAILAIEQAAPLAAHWSLAEYTRLVNTEIVLVAEKEGKVSGFVCAKMAAGDWEIENVAVSAAFARQGVASELLRELIRRANGAASTIFLEVRESNAPARLLYEKHGFVEQGHRRAYYRNPAEDAVLYLFRLNP